MAEPSAAAKPVNKPLLMVLLAICAVGTVWCSAMAWEEFFKHEAGRKEGLAWTFTGLAWFLFWSWRIRALGKPFPTQ